MFIYSETLQFTQSEQCNLCELNQLSCSCFFTVTQRFMHALLHIQICVLLIIPTNYNSSQHLFRIDSLQTVKHSNILFLVFHSTSLYSLQSFSFTIHNAVEIQPVQRSYNQRSLPDYNSFALMHVIQTESETSQKFSRWWPS